jgi:hypothetical protein
VGNNNPKKMAKESPLVESKTTAREPEAPAPEEPAAEVVPPRELTADDAAFLLAALKEIEERCKMLPGPNTRAVAIMARRAIDATSSPRAPG